ncbi:hypothetical protein BDV28DRAFT_117939 [Aspergillus coremiiformis]|uniref:Uncharacterized protein n=1 Tax=Aspergillus coremiiformis TaxID=138285 RepID=A0A5N6ZA86_9EURO|nr:hypothetical protein BDV28DRAFT_117939 [Aspergillus coremiiformis]
MLPISLHGLRTPYRLFESLLIQILRNFLTSPVRTGPLLIPLILFIFVSFGEQLISLRLLRQDLSLRRWRVLFWEFY